MTKVRAEFCQHGPRLEDIKQGFKNMKAGDISQNGRLAKVARDALLMVQTLPAIIVESMLNDLQAFAKLHWQTAKAEGLNNMTLADCKAKTELYKDRMPALPFSDGVAVIVGELADHMATMDSGGRVDTLRSAANHLAAVLHDNSNTVMSDSIEHVGQAIDEAAGLEIPKDLRELLDTSVTICVGSLVEALSNGTGTLSAVGAELLGQGLGVLQHRVGAGGLCATYGRGLVGVEGRGPRQDGEWPREGEVQ